MDPQQSETWVNNQTGEEAQIRTLSAGYTLVELSNGMIMGVKTLKRDWTRKE